MIQRIQSVYMFGVIIISAILLFVPFAQLDDYAFDAYAISLGKELVTTVFGGVGALILTILALDLVALFLFKKRKIQKRLNFLNIILNALLIAAIVMYHSEAIEKLNLEVNYSFTAFLPAISIVLLFLANWAIKKDDDLIKSVDRIR